MESVLKNDILEGNKTILHLARLLYMPYKSKIVAQIIFHHAYPKLFKKESYNIVALVCVYLASKINETLIKMETILDAIPRATSMGTTPHRERLIAIECKVIELIEFQFNIRPAQLFLLRIGKTLNTDVLRKLAVLDEIHGDGRVNLIKYFNGVYEPEMVALSVLDDDELILFECFFGVAVSRVLVEEIRSVLLKK
ncbi:similarity to CYCLIN K (C-TYPE) [Encephalitozoon cuniculi GB-M1]|uniref:Similarity to CYCLIN K (C-TYPE) n=2 Tax=Encephalitozoon cuniculi TaxID=6035 RepID=Q8SWJ0_ENCCU|nr:cyclin K-like protein [Encephalitozoon cuniculi GB-M1]AGE96085.1 cyclin k [Encephalitozoon cuniculi]KMV66771.1 cyclin K-like protein [Encephalitozoon cuniculi EcunIII-L]UYI28489.1 cyclin [Encephalitozoon cuniculi]CAD24988.1 similarity to CYCLIN K (C-TYPE) [Encephalitozoon cuniculi GB-M1]